MNKILMITLIVVVCALFIYFILIPYAVTPLILKIFWEQPLEQKHQDEANLESVQNTVEGLSEKIIYVANRGGKDSINSSFVATWNVNSLEDSISVIFISKTSKVALDAGWISFTQGATCPPSAGILGIDSPSVICVKAESKNNQIEITYKLWFRELDGHKISLENVGKEKSSSVKSIFIEKSSGEITTIDISLIE